MRREFGVNAAALKAAWLRGWVEARQAGWIGDGRRTQTVYCFEDVHLWLEKIAHKVSREYAERWWTDEAVKAFARKTPKAREEERAGARQRGFYFAFTGDKNKTEEKR